MLSLLWIWAFCLEALNPGPVSAREVSVKPELLKVTISPPVDGKPGTLSLVASKARLLEELREAIPESVPIDDQKLGDPPLIYRDVQLNNLKAVDLKPLSLVLEGDTLRVEGEPRVIGNLNALYEHIVFTTEIHTLFSLFGQEVKSSVPVTKSDWRPKGAAPFSVRASVRSTCKLSFTEGVLSKSRLQLDTRCEYAKITEVTLGSDEVLFKLAKEVIGAVGEVMPNEGFNKPIKDNLSRRFEIDPFKDLSPKHRDILSRMVVKNVSIKSSDSNVTVTADLVAP